MRRGTQRIEPGWYTDPADAEQVRWHDGDDFTERTQPVMRRFVEDQTEMLHQIKRDVASIAGAMQLLVLIAVLGIAAGIVALIIVNN